MPKKKNKRIRTGLKAGETRHRSPSGKWITVLIVSGAVVALIVFAMLPDLIRRRGTIENVLLLTLQATRADQVGAYGNAAARTPALDQAALEGIRFENCSSASPLSLPANCSILTGTTPHTHGVRGDEGERLADTAETLAELLQRAGYATHAVVASPDLGRECGLDQGFDGYDASGAESPAEDVADRTIAALERLAEGPFFIWASFDDPLRALNSADVSAADPSEAYAGALASVDAQIARLIETLSRLEIERNTLVVIVGDHGVAMGEHEEFGSGFFLYESSLRVPLILRCPAKLPQGRALSPVVRTTDVVPTILDYLARSPAAAAQGKSVRGLITPSGRVTERIAYAETDLPAKALGLSSLRSIRQGAWKYIHSTRPELYNVESDPGETVNVAETRDELVRSMQEQLRAIGALAPDPRPADRLEVSGESPADHARAITAYAQALRLMDAGEYARSVTIFREVLMELPEAPEPLRNLATALDLQGRPADFAIECREILQARPEARQIRLRLDEWLAASGATEGIARPAGEKDGR